MNEKNSTLGEYIFAVSCSLAYEIRALQHINNMLPWLLRLFIY